MMDGSIKLGNGEELFYTECNTKYLGEQPSLLFVHGNISSSYSGQTPSNISNTSNGTSLLSI